MRTDASEVLLELRADIFRAIELTYDSDAGDLVRVGIGVLCPTIAGQVHESACSMLEVVARNGKHRGGGTYAFRVMTRPDDREPGSLLVRVDCTAIPPGGSGTPAW